MKNKDLLNNNKIEELLLKPYAIPHTICISSLPSAKKMRMAAVNINASIFLKDTKTMNQ